MREADMVNSGKPFPLTKISITRENRFTASGWRFSEGLGFEMFFHPEGGDNLDCNGGGSDSDSI